MPRVPSGAPESTQHPPPEFRQFPVTLRPNARAGEEPLDSKAWDHLRPSVCSPPPTPAGGAWTCFAHATRSASFPLSPL